MGNGRVQRWSKMGRLQTRRCKKLGSLRRSSSCVSFWKSTKGHGALSSLEKTIKETFAAEFQFIEAAEETYMI
jgi:hypothetical protein